MTYAGFDLGLVLAIYNDNIPLQILIIFIYIYMTCQTAVLSC